MRKLNTHFMDILPLLFVVVFIVLNSIGYKPFNMSSSGSIIELDGSWQDKETGEPVSLKGTDKSNIKVFTGVKGVDTYKYKLCFKSEDTYVTVYADDKVIYDYEPDVNKFLGKSYGIYAHTVAIPDNTKIITLELHSIFDNDSVKISDAAFQSESSFIFGILKKGMTDILMCAILLIFGITMIAIGQINKKLDLKSDMNVNFTSVGIFAILVSFWAVNDTYVLQMLFQKPDLIKASSCISLIFVPYMPTSFIYTMTKSKHKCVPMCVGTVTLLVLILNLVLSISGLSDYSKLTWIMQIMTPITVFFIARMIFISIREGDIDRQKFSAVLLGINSMALGAMVDIIRHKIHENHRFSNGAFTKLGVMIFILALGVQLAREKNRKQIEANENEIKAKLAYTDGLTGLQNRLSFNNTEKVLGCGVQDCIIIQLDINDLKKVNDTYGHSEGDKHIINGAKVIKDSFNLGTCYRTGGDEFIVVMHNGTEEELGDALHTMNEKIKQYNDTEEPPVNLAIAYGYAFFNHESDRIDQVEKLADERMYQKKREMKGERRKSLQ